MSEESDVQKLREAMASHIRAARAFRNLSQRELAKKVGISFSEMHRIEAGKVSVEMETFAKIMAVLRYKWAFGCLEPKREV